MKVLLELSSDHLNQCMMQLNPDEQKWSFEFNDNTNCQTVTYNQDDKLNKNDHYFNYQNDYFNQNDHCNKMIT